MDLKEAGQRALPPGHDPPRAGRLDLVGAERTARAGRVPRVDPARAPSLFRGLHGAISAGLVRSCHDLSEGGLAVALAEMALAGGLGATVSPGSRPLARPTRPTISSCSSRNLPRGSSSRSRRTCRRPRSPARRTAARTPGTGAAASGRHEGRVASVDRPRTRRRGRGRRRGGRLESRLATPVALAVTRPSRRCLAE